jgi:methyl-accepting chemotaxis protein
MDSLAIALLPLSALLVLLVLDRFLKTRQLRGEKQGLPVEQALMELLLALQQHRGLSGAYLNGDAAFRSKMFAVQRQIDARISEAQGQCPQLTALAAEQWRAVREQWCALRDIVERLPAAESFARHSALINQLLELKSRYADACGMTLDPHPASYGLLDALVAKVPATLEHVAQARGMGTGIAARGSMSFEERMRMVALSTLIRHSLASLRQALATAGAHSGSLQEIDGFLRLINQSLVNSAEVRLNPESYFAQGSQAIEAGHRLYADIGRALAEQFQQRAAGYRRQLRLAAFAVLVLLAAGAYWRF